MFIACMQVTPALKKYVTDKFSNALSKVGKRVTKCDVHLIYDKNPSVPEPNHVEVLCPQHIMHARSKGRFSHTLCIKIQTSMKF